MSAACDLLSRPAGLRTEELDLWNKAQSASPGPWQPDESGWFVVGDTTTLASTCGYSSSASAVANAHYIAAVSPDRIRHLLTELGHLRSQLRAITELSTVLELQAR